MFLRFSDADRERFGVEEWIELTPSMTVLEAEALDVLGGNWAEINDRGARQTRYRLWLALHRAGVKVGSLSELDDVDIAAVRSLDSLPGKAVAEDSAPADSDTSPTSASSTPRSTKARSKRST